MKIHDSNNVEFRNLFKEDVKNNSTSDIKISKLVQMVLNEEDEDDPTWSNNAWSNNIWDKVF